MSHVQDFIQIPYLNQSSSSVRTQGILLVLMEVSNTLPYSIGDEPSSSNYRPFYCNKCDADSEKDCICSTNNSGFGSIYQQGGECKACSQDHSHHTHFSGVQTSIDIIPELLETQHNDHNILDSIDTYPDPASIFKKDVRSEDSSNSIPRKTAKGGGVSEQ